MDIKLNENNTFRIDTVFNTLLDKDKTYITRLIYILTSNNYSYYLNENDFKVIKRVIDKFKLKENEMIIQFPEYVRANYKDNQLNTLYQSLIKNYLDIDTSRSSEPSNIPYVAERHIFVNIKRLVESNLNYMNSVLAKEIIDYLFQHFKKNEKSIKDNEEQRHGTVNFNSKYFFLFKSIIILMKKIESQELFKTSSNYKEKLLSMFNVSFKAFLSIYNFKSEKRNEKWFFDNMSLELKYCLTFIEIFKCEENSPPKEYETFCDILLKLTLFSTNCNSFIQTKYYNQLKFGINSNKSTIFLKDEPIQCELIDFRHPKLSVIIETLLKNCCFHIAKFKSYLKTFSQKQPSISILGLSAFQMIPIFEEYEKYNNNKLVPNSIASKIQQRLMLKNQGDLTIYQIENKYLLEQPQQHLGTKTVSNRSNNYNIINHYDNSFTKLIKSHKSLESALEILFENLEIPSTKYDYLKTKIDYLIAALDIGSIDQFIYPIFKKECERSETYRKKQIIKQQHVAAESPTTSPTLSSRRISNKSRNISKSMNENESQILPFYLIKDILLLLIDDSKTSQYCKLMVSLVCKKYFETVQEIMNNSTVVPIEFSFRFTNREFSSYSLLQRNVKYLKYNSRENHGEEDIQLYLSNNHYAFSFVEDFGGWNFIFKHFKNLEILDIKGMITEHYLNYMFQQRQLQKIKQEGEEEEGRLKKLILRTTHSNRNTFSEQLDLLKKDGMLIELHLWVNIIESDYLETDYGQIESCIINIGQYISETFYDDILPLFKHLKIEVEQFDPESVFHEHNHYDDIHPLDFFLKYPRKNSHQPLFSGALESVEFIFKADDTDFNIKKILKSIDRVINNIIDCHLTFNFSRVARTIQISTINLIFEIVSNIEYFKNVNRITIIGYGGYPLYSDIGILNLHNFIEIVPFNNTEFKRVIKEDQIIDQGKLEKEETEGRKKVRSIDDIEDEDSGEDSGEESDEGSLYHSTDLGDSDNIEEDDSDDDDDDDGDDDDDDNDDDDDDSDDGIDPSDLFKFLLLNGMNNFMKQSQHGHSHR